MADLSDFLGHILEELTRARVMADVETIRTAKLYASDENGLLKNFPIPRMRLPNIEITVPVVIDGVPDGYVEKTDPILLNKALSADIRQILKEQKIHLTLNEITRIIGTDEQLAKGELRPLSIDSVTSRISSHILSSAQRKEVPADIHEKVVAEVRKQVEKTLSQLPKKPVGININPRSSAIKEYSQSPDQSASVVYLKLSITEDALNMDFDTTNERPELKRLVPE